MRLVRRKDTFGNKFAFVVFMSTNTALFSMKCWKCMLYCPLGEGWNAHEHYCLLHCDTISKNLKIEVSKTIRHLWLIHTTRARDRDRDREWDEHNRKQWFPFPVPVACSVNEILHLGPSLICWCIIPQKNFTSRLRNPVTVGQLRTISC